MYIITIQRFFLFFFLLFSSIGSYAIYTPQNGDIIFQSSKSAQSKAVEQATNSSYSHMGIIFIKNDKAYVLEAAGQVSYTPLQNWINRGINKNYVIKRLKDTSLTNDDINKLQTVSQTFIGKPYDILFGWDDDKIYCSELVWKIYDRALNIQIGQLQTIKDFNLSSPIVKQKLQERYGNNIPYNEKVISPVAMYNSPLLIVVDSQWNSKKSR